MNRKEKIYLVVLILIIFISIISIISLTKNGPKLKPELYENNNRKFLIINAGSNMGKVKTKQGYKLKLGFLNNQLELMTKDHTEIPVYDILEYTKPTSSSHTNPTDWVKIASEITKNYVNYDAIIVIYHIETMCYAASAISFMLENLKKPIIFTGSPVSIHEHNEHARKNLFQSIYLAVKHSIPEVIITYNNQYLRACRSTYSNQTIFSPYMRPIGEVKKGKIQITDKIILKPSNEDFMLSPLNDKINIILVKVFPGINSNYLEGVLKSHKNVNGIILELYGHGQTPLNQEFLDKLEEIIKNGTYIVQTSMFHSNVDVLNTGIINGMDMTVEAAFTKLLFLLSNVRNPNLEIITQLMQISMRGELNNPNIPTKSTI